MDEVGGEDVMHMNDVTMRQRVYENKDPNTLSWIFLHSSAYVPTLTLLPPLYCAMGE